MEDLTVHVLMIFLFFIVSCLFLKIFYFIWWRPKSVEKSLRQQRIRGTTYKPLIGDMKEHVKVITEAWSKPISLSHHIASRVDPFTSNIIQKYGKISLCWRGTSPTLTMMDPKLIKEVLSNKQGHIGKPPLNPLIRILTRGLTTLEAEKWAAHRRIINPVFHLEKLKGMIPVFVSSSDVLIEKWKKSITDEGIFEVDLWPEFQELTGDVISRTAFGSNYEEGKEILKLQKELQKLVIEAMQTLYIPGFRFIPTKKNRRRKELDRKITSMLTDLIERKEHMMRRKETHDDNLLSMLLQSNYEQNLLVNESNTKSNHMTMEEIIEECKLFYLAGHETTASWLTWTIIVLAMHPNWQQKAREEVLQLCRDKDPDAEVISHLKIVNMILLEVLRLYPPVIALYQHVHKETKIGDLNIHPGTDLVLPILFVNRDPELWGDDAEEFKPERFSEGVSKACKDQKAFLPFGWGPRTCIGQNFAIIEAKVALTMMLKRFSFELSVSYTHSPYTVMTLQPQHGAQIIVHLL